VGGEKEGKRASKKKKRSISGGSSLHNWLGVHDLFCQKVVRCVKARKDLRKTMGLRRLNKAVRIAG